MMLCLFASLILQLGFSATEAHIEGGVRAETNAFYRDREKVEDFAVYLKPVLNLISSGRTLDSGLYLTSDYSKYFSNSSLDYFDYNGSANVNLKVKRWSLHLGGDYGFSSEPPDDQGMERTDRTDIGVSAEVRYQKSNVRQHSLKVYNNQTDFNLTTLRYANNQKIGGTYQYQYYFLPETAFVVVADAESSTYADGLDFLNADPGTTRYLYDNMLLQGRVGIRGRLTEFTTVDLLFGYAARGYKKSSNYNEPVFSVIFNEQITPQDILTAGYKYQVLDSFYTNYELNQHMFLGYSRVFGDRFIIFFRADYIYKSYSLPNRREDQLLNGTLRVDISYKPNWIIQAGINGDFLVSDTLNQTSATVVDPASSYQALQVFVGSKLTF